MGSWTIAPLSAFEVGRKSVPFQTGVDPKANYAFKIGMVPPPFEYRRADADDAWKRTLEFLARYQPVAAR